MVTRVRHRSNRVAALLAIFLGLFGAHRFYVGRVKAGLIRLGVTFVAVLLTGITGNLLPMSLVAILCCIEGIVYALMGDGRFNGKYVNGAAASSNGGRGAADYVICALAVAMMCSYGAIALQPTGSTVPEQTPVPVRDPAPVPAEREDPEPEPELDELTATFIDVGQGDSTLVGLPDGKVMLVDAGEASASQNVLDALDAADVETIDYLVASHPHADHIGGMEAVLAAYDVDEVWMPDVSEATQTYEGFLDAVENEDCTVRRAVAGAKISSNDAGYDVDVLAPSDGMQSDDMNRWSAIIRVSYGDTSLLLTGDADASQIVEADPGHVDVLKASHHGSETGTTTEVMAATTPDTVIMSYAEGNDYGHPDQSVLDAVAAAGSKAYSTAANGNVTMVSDARTVTVAPDHDGTITAGESAEERAQREAQEQAQREAEEQARIQAEQQAAQQAQQQAQQQQQAASPQDDMVAITQTGEKYHRPGCRTLSRSKNTRTVTRAEAEAMGLGPCGVCNP
ncbi:MBL fold metallo-hydrolase [uncultured Bifidobacterium sp.]|uniref:MBL fold metallo-hydrolase n=1 Tax=uncultured Bifidobacterium sp. TaxID=165187 RepID=UPI00259717BD|nr:MBL fold metallo-hydrolase [uncultured Bifidobacterium sp.]